MKKIIYKIDERRGRLPTNISLCPKPPRLRRKKADLTLFFFCPVCKSGYHLRSSLRQHLKKVHDLLIKDYNETVYMTNAIAITTQSELTTSISSLQSVIPPVAAKPEKEGGFSKNNCKQKQQQVKQEQQNKVVKD
eukprot:Awhi_evm1s13974